ncbi:MAG: hypothetical protein AABW88_05305 [Nanoarchaeota archaeon]
MIRVGGDAQQRSCAQLCIAEIVPCGTPTKEDKNKDKAEWH